MIIRIGKASDNDFVVNDPHVSRYHAKLIREEGGCWLLEDLGSTNGTFVNGAQIVKKHVTPSDTIKLGELCVKHFRSLEVQQRLQRRVCCAEASLR